MKWPPAGDPRVKFTSISIMIQKYDLKFDHTLSISCSNSVTAFILLKACAWKMNNKKRIYYSTFSKCACVQIWRVSIKLIQCNMPCDGNLGLPILIKAYNETIYWEVWVILLFWVFLILSLTSSSSLTALSLSLRCYNHHHHRHYCYCHLSSYCHYHHHHHHHDHYCH